MCLNGHVSSVLRNMIQNSSWNDTTRRLLNLHVLYKLLNKSVTRVGRSTGHPATNKFVQGQVRDRPINVLPNNCFILTLVFFNTICLCNLVSSVSFLQRAPIPWFLN